MTDQKRREECSRVDMTAECKQTRCRSIEGVIARRFLRKAFAGEEAVKILTMDEGAEPLTRKPAS